MNMQEYLQNFPKEMVIGELMTVGDVLALYARIDELEAKDEFVVDAHIIRQSHWQPLGEQTALTYGDSDLAKNIEPPCWVCGGVGAVSDTGEWRECYECEGNGFIKKETDDWASEWEPEQTKYVKLSPDNRRDIEIHRNGKIRYYRSVKYYGRLEQMTHPVMFSGGLRILS